MRPLVCRTLFLKTTAWIFLKFSGYLKYKLIQRKYAFEEIPGTAVAMATDLRFFSLKASEGTFLKNYCMDFSKIFRISLV